MAQSTVKNFFAVRKGNGGIQPSKRLKVQQSTSVDSISQNLPETKSVIPTIESLTAGYTKGVQQPGLNVPESVSTKSTTKTKAKSVQKSTSRSRNQPSHSKAQPGIVTALRVTRSSSRSSSPVNEVEESEVKKGIQEVGEVVTAACDDHTVSPPTTPTKRTSTTKGTTGGKRSKHVKAIRKDLLAEMQPEMAAEPGYDFSKFLNKAEVVSGLEEKVSRKRLVMKRRNDEHVNEKKTESEDETKELAPSVEVPPAAAKENKATRQKASSKSKPSEAIPETKKSSKAETMDLASIRARLAKSGKLSELQERLATFSTAAAKMKEDKKIQRLADLKSEKERANEAAKPKKAPAFERYRTLAEPVPPGLTLPYKYKLLLDVFHSVDTVVSMLHNRTEVCTFNKLKNAVQIMTRKNFEEKHLAQIKTVFPEGFLIRQEKGIAIPGTGCVSNWQLTIEANLDEEKVDKDAQRKDGRPTFTATVVLERKALFHSLLSEIVKTHHREFLSTMDRPLTVPDDKVTRWHPRFKVDQVPDIVPAHLPQPPDVKKFTTAAQVLEEARTKNTVLNARVQKALENVAKQKKAQEEKVAAKKAKDGPEKKITSEQKPAADVKGIPQSMLERIRAKEAEKQVRDMMQTPAEEKRKAMISRLPDVVRILRTFFVTCKKPCLAIEDAIKKVSDSAKSSMGSVEAEAHIDLLIELVPEWVSVVKVRKGSYLKVDRNQDISSVINKINTFLKT